MLTEEVIYNFMEKGYDEILLTAQGSLSAVTECLDKFYDEDKDAYNAFIDLIGSIIYIDYEISPKELKFYNDLFSSYLSFDEFKKIMEGKTKYTSREATDNFIDMVGSKISEDLKYDFLVIILAFAVCDERLTYDEKKYFLKLKR